MPTERGRPALDIVNLSELDPEWNWLAGAALGERPLHWSHASAAATVSGRAAPLRRAGAAWRALSMLGPRPDAGLLVSHGPRMTMWGALAGRALRRRPRHLAYSFNFTDLPQGGRLRVLRAAYAKVDRFVCFSHMERELYARHFDLDPGRIEMIHWAARPPVFDAAAVPAVAGAYISAIGSQGRDYATLLEAMRRLPHIRLAIVATADSLAGLVPPANVEVLTSIPLPRAMDVLHRSRFTVVPLRDGAVPCGHVTIVSAMHAGKAAIVTASTGVADYIEPGRTGIAVAPGHAAALAAAIEQLWNDDVAAQRVGMAAQAFAREHCGEAAVVAWFARYLHSLEP